MYTKLPNGQIVYEEDYSCVLDPVNGVGGIFIGNLEAAQNIKTLRKNNIRAVLTAAKGVDITHPKSEVPFYLQIQGEDRDGFDLSRFFPQAIKFIRECLQKTNIMVHCLAGVSRSVCLVLAYLIQCREMSYQKAYDMIKARRKIIHPNDGFISQLKKFEQEQNRSKGNSSVQYGQHSKAYSPSPTKRRYEYINEIDEPVEKYAPPRFNNNYQRSERLLESPSKIKRQYEYSNYIPTHKEYESPIKRKSINYEPKYNNLFDYQNNSPSRHRNPSSPYKYDRKPQYEHSYSPSKLKMKKVSSFSNNFQGYNRMRGLESQQYKDEVQNQRLSNGLNGQYRGRSSSNIKLDEPRRFFGDNAINTKYDICEISPSELSQQLDRKIAKIREKYSEYTNDNLKVGKKTMEKQGGGFDENDFYGTLSMRKIVSDMEPNKVNPEIGSIRNNYMQGGGLAIRRLSSMKQGYY